MKQKKFLYIVAEDAGLIIEIPWMKLPVDIWKRKTYAEAIQVFDQIRAGRISRLKDELERIENKSHIFIETETGDADDEFH